MKTRLVITIGAVVLYACAAAGGAKEAVKDPSGAELFKTHCNVCHPGGGNVINPKKTLHKKDLEANNVKKPEDVIRNMRNPGPGMTPFAEATITDGDAKKIAEYILTTF